MQRHFDGEINVINRSRSSWSLRGHLIARPEARPGEINKLLDFKNSNWRHIMAEIGRGDYVLISPTLNERCQHDYDCWYVGDKRGDYQTVEEGTPGAKYFTFYECAQEYRGHLLSCIHEVKQAGAMPILLSHNGCVSESASDSAYIPGRLTTGVDDCLNLMCQIAQEESIPYADSTRVIYEKYLEIMEQNHQTLRDVLNLYGMTSESVARFYRREGFVGSRYETWLRGEHCDAMKFNEDGAAMAARVMIRVLTQIVPELKQHVID